MSTISDTNSLSDSSATDSKALMISLTNPPASSMTLGGSDQVPGLITEEHIVDEVDIVRRLVTTSGGSNSSSYQRARVAVTVAQLDVIRAAVQLCGEASNEMAFGAEAEKLGVTFSVASATTSGDSKSSCSRSPQAARHR